MLRVVKIRMEYLEHPVGLGELPWFGWVLESDRKNVVQKAYQLQIAGDPQFEDILRIETYRLEDGNVVSFPGVLNENGERKTIRCSNILIRVIKEGQ